MYVACVPLRLEGRLVKPDEPIPSIEKWTECAIRSNLNLGWIKFIENEPAVAPKELVTGVEAKEGLSPVDKMKVALVNILGG